MNKTDNTRILVVDDDEKYLSSLRRIMRGVFEIITTKDPIHALKIFEHNGPFAVVISDYRMPFINGIELFSRIHAKDKNAQRIMLTGYAELQMAIDAINHGKINAFLTKPTPVVSIRAVVIDAIRAYNLNRDDEIHEKNNTMCPPKQGVSEIHTPLTVKEKEVLCLLVIGSSNEEIARKLNISIGTVKSHVHNLFEKMNVNSRSKVVARAMDLGLYKP